MKRTRDGEAKVDQQDDAIEVIDDEPRAVQNAGNASAEKGESALKSEATTPQPTKRARKQADLKPEEILPRLILRRIIKENHGSPIKQIAFNFTKRSNYNLVATVGGNQASVYDNEHGVGKNAGHLDLMLNYVNPGQRSELNTCAWLGDLDPDENGEDTDTYLAVGGYDSLIHIISIARCRVICILRGHKGAIHDLVAHPNRVGFLLSVGADQTTRLWDCRNPYAEPEKTCLVTFEGNATVASFSADGSRFITGGVGGTLREFAIPGEYFNDDDDKTIGRTISECKVLPKKHRVDVDSVRAVGGLFISKDIEGKIVVWQALDGEVVRTIRVPDCRLNARSRFDVSQDGEFLCAGNSAGAVFIYNLQTGDLVAKLQSGRSKHPAQGCVFSHSCHHVALVCAEPFIYRWSLPEETEEPAPPSTDAATATSDDQQKAVENRTSNSPAVSSSS